MRRHRHIERPQPVTWAFIMASQQPISSGQDDQHRLVLGKDEKPEICHWYRLNESVRRLRSTLVRRFRVDKTQKVLLLPLSSCVSA